MKFIAPLIVLLAVGILPPAGLRAQTGFEPTVIDTATPPSPAPAGMA